MWTLHVVRRRWHRNGSPPLPRGRTPRAKIKDAPNRDCARSGDRRAEQFRALSCNLTTWSGTACAGPGARIVRVRHALSGAAGPRRQALLERVVAATAPRIAADEAPSRPLGGVAIGLERKRRDSGQREQDDPGHWPAPCAGRKLATFISPPRIFSPLNSPANADRRHEPSAAPMYAVRSSAPRRCGRHGARSGCHAAAIEVSPAALASGSRTAPSHASFSTMRARMLGEFSPMPAVNTKASSPPSAAASRPAWSPTR